MRYVFLDGKWHIYQMDAARAESTACGLGGWDYDPEWTHREPKAVCAKCAKVAEKDADAA